MSTYIRVYSGLLYIHCAATSVSFILRFSNIRLLSSILFADSICSVRYTVYIVSQRHPSCYKADGWRAIIRLRINKTARGMMMDRESLYLIEENNSINRNSIFIHPSIHRSGRTWIHSLFLVPHQSMSLYIHRWREREIFSSFVLSFRLLGELYSSIASPLFWVCLLHSRVERHPSRVYIIRDGLMEPFNVVSCQLH